MNVIIRKITGIDWQKTSTKVLNKCCTLLTVPRHPKITENNLFLTNGHLTYAFELYSVSFLCVHRIAVKSFFFFLLKFNGHFWLYTVGILGKYKIKCRSHTQKKVKYYQSETHDSYNKHKMITKSEQTKRHTQHYYKLVKQNTNLILWTDKMIMNQNHTQ